MADEEKADWAAIFIHFICGFIVSGGLTFGVIMRRGHLVLSLGWHNAIFVLCMSVGIGAIYALYQNEIWNENTYSIIPPMPARHSRLSRLVLKIISGLAFICAILAQFFVK